MIAARSRGLAAIAVPGVHAWRPEWAPLLAGRQVTVAMDADREGRQAAARIARDLERVADVEVIDVAPARDDGYDLSNLLLARPGWSAADGLRSLIAVQHGGAGVSESPRPRGVTGDAVAARAPGGVSTGLGGLSAISTREVTCRTF
jgi:hypothetical protein